ncbi:hypothetical protein EIN_475370 [Entamoeba invadens IP1]|uniref:Leucine rich repeat containing protein BspA family protein n=1 Tax=Entamoeba invadens IP1 TaxID=370355 RepID=A0A0A1U9Q3_ENTIV|nr:hypothetical protein EIN_475370 [Entamoeba invadens IP1]ELP88855.1 hypothetical protein EIN_475370 [Entamoeba invadens IP1]|eukprot:XP_004255626.1 hypothetical protein EIN_475370 [Entamoeba invadens IP1]
MTKLGSYHIVNVSKYFKTIEDFINLTFVCKKYSSCTEKFDFNPIPLTNKTFKYFPKMKILHLWKKEDENFGNGFIIKEKDVNYEDINKGREIILKKDFDGIVVWFEVIYATYEKNKNPNIKLKNVIYTKNDRIKFGNEIPKGVTKLDEGCFRDCKELHNVEIPFGVSAIYPGCFYDCNFIDKVTIPPSVRYINSYSFFRMSQFRNFCFFKCANLCYLTIPSIVQVISEQCFDKCIKLRNVTLPSKLVSIEKKRFYKCSSIESLNIPLGVTELGQYCFYKCKGLRSVTIPSSLTIINNFFTYCLKLHDIIIPSSVVSLGYHCFRECNIESVVIPSSQSEQCYDTINVISLGESCFECCGNLSEIDIPSSVKSIGDGCFDSHTLVNKK